jgi:hypothetical protein
MTLFRTVTQKGETQGQEPTDRFEARLDALSQMIERPTAGRPSLFAVRKRGTPQEA